MSARSASSTSSTSPTSSVTPTLGNSAWTIGLPVRVKTLAGETIEGKVFAYDVISGCLTIQRHRSSTAPEDAKPDYTIVKLNFIQEVKLLPQPNKQNGTRSSSAGDNEASMPAVRALPLDRLRAREVRHIREAQQAEARRGVGVSKEAQDIFDALSKTLPCRWRKQSIIVMDDVLIETPYNVGSCKANPSSASLLARVKKVLEGERKQMGLPR